MPFALTTIGILFIVVGFQDTYKAFFTQVESDFSGSDSFIYWFVSIGIVGSLGYIPELKTFSRASMALILIVMFIANKGGVFAQFNQQITAGSTAAVNPIGDAVQGTSSGSTSSSSGGILSTAETLAPLALAAF